MLTDVPRLEQIAMLVYRIEDTVESPLTEACFFIFVAVDRVEGRALVDWEPPMVYI